jgi:hypothetical protein
MLWVQARPLMDLHIRCPVRLVTLALPLRCPANRVAPGLRRHSKEACHRVCSSVMNSRASPSPLSNAVNSAMLFVTHLPKKFARSANTVKSPRCFSMSGCTIRDCGAPASVTGYSISAGGTTYGSTRSVACATGYSGTAATITCSSSGTWNSCSGCTIVNCCMYSCCEHWLYTGLWLDNLGLHVFHDLRLRATLEPPRL